MPSASASLLLIRPYAMISLFASAELRGQFLIAGNRHTLRSSEM